MKNLKTISEQLKDYPAEHVANFCAYINKIETEKDRKTKQLKNPWMNYKTEEYLVRIFKSVALDGLVFDGEDITLQSTGVSYSYQAFKNKMFVAYPESIIDVNLVYKGDAFNFSKNSGQVNYTHSIENPFGHDDKDIVGAYCVIKNKRGQFLTTLSRQEIDKHRKVAKTDYIWKNWLPEMCMKTVVKKACKQHFKDTYSNIETLDNENYDLEKLDHIDKEKVDEIEKLIKESGADLEKFLAWGKCESIETLLIDKYNPAISLLKAKIK